MAIALLVRKPHLLAPGRPRTLKLALSRRFFQTAPEGKTGTGPVRAFGEGKDLSHDQNRTHLPFFLQGRLAS